MLLVVENRCFMKTVETGDFQVRRKMKFISNSNKAPKLSCVQQIIMEALSGLGFKPSILVLLFLTDSAIGCKGQRIVKDVSHLISDEYTLFYYLISIDSGAM
ncbi:hypothetical protein ARMGADRAFT_1037682 [Armillaria gallica]|uniref:Uncharacterized protein n=1 Tax=Armillaria gallica TaxID=47427 RepID=A0A2H3D3R9_ARMGA|nr:hypothetical protein ARMGADRAFT_1037682 [Armillaria gallica]